MNTDLELRAEQIFDRTAELPTAVRLAAARAACGDDPALRARVEQLVDADTVDGFMARPTAHGDVAAAAAAAARVGERPGDRIGPYKLLEQIGEGGFGVVFMAEQERPVRRRVALKVIKLGMDTREVVARFEAERQALALMDHPNIAKVLDAGSTDAGRPFFVMELVRGCPITEYADGQRLTTAQRVALAEQVARAVQHAHSKGVIHRDLKPSNVLVTVADDKPIPKVIDFGIAKATQARLTDRTLFTAHRQLIGTPQYMSPEQADSNGVDVDTRTDVYSLGVLLYELLVGTTPFDAKALRSAAFEAMRRMIRDTDVPRPATRLHTLAAHSQSAIAASRSTDVKRLAQSVTGELDWIVMKALEKDRARRYDTAAALADDLNRFLSGEAVLAGPATAAYRLRKLARRYRAAVAVGGAVAAALLLGVAGTSWGLVEARQQRTAAIESKHRAEAGEADARRQKAAADANAAEADRQKQAATASAAAATAKAAEAKATLDFFTGLLKRASPRESKDAAVSKVLVDKLIAPALATVDRQFAGQPLVRATVQHRLARTLLDLGRFDLAEPQAKAAYDARRHLLGADHPDTLAALHDYARVTGMQGRHAEAETLIKQCWDARRRVLGDDHPDTLAALNDYAIAVGIRGRLAEAERLSKQCWDASRRVRGDDDPETLAALNNYARVIYTRGRPAAAEPLFKQLWDARRRVSGDDDLETLAALNNYAAAVLALGRPAEAEPLYKQCWATCRRVLGADHPDTLFALNNYAAVIVALGRPAEAEPLLKQRWDESRRVLGDSHPLTVQAGQSYAAFRRTLGLSPGRSPATEPARVAPTSRAADVAAAAAGARGRAAALSAGHHSAAAEPLYRQAVDLDRAAGPAVRADLAADLLDWGDCLQRLGRPAQAEPPFREAMSILWADHGPTEPPRLDGERRFAGLLLSLGQTAEAVATYRAAVAADDAGGVDVYWTSNDRMDLAKALEKAGDVAGAEAALRQAVAIRQAVPKWGHTGRDTQAAARRLAAVLDREGKPAEAAAVRADAGLPPPTPAARP